MMRIRTLVLAAGVAAMSAGSALAQTPTMLCGELTNHYGPFDYRPEKFRPIDNRPYFDMLNVVERAHFTAEIEGLIRGKSAPLGAELDYTLRAFPNHHRALVAVMRWGEKTNTPQPPTLPRPVECYFDRALRFTPDDTIARLLYATFLVNRKRNAQAVEQLERTRSYAGDNGFTHYNIGLVFLDAGEHEQALVQAHRAMALDFPRTELKSRLVALGKWRDPPAVEVK